MSLHPNINSDAVVAALHEASSMIWNPGRPMTCGHKIFERFVENKAKRQAPWPKYSKTFVVRVTNKLKIHSDYRNNTRARRVWHEVRTESRTIHECRVDIYKQPRTFEKDFYNLITPSHEAATYGDQVRNEKLSELNILVWEQTKSR